MNNFLAKLNKLSLSATILLAVIILGGFYFSVGFNKQRSIERQQQIKIEQEKKEKLAEQQAEEKTEQALNICIADAEGAYSNQWYRECRRLGELSNKCIDIHELTFSDYLDKYGLMPEEYNNQRGVTNVGNLTKDFLAGGLDYLKRRNDECSCALPISLAGSVNESLEKSKDTCFRQY